MKNLGFIIWAIIAIMTGVAMFFNHDYLWVFLPSAFMILECYEAPQEKSNSYSEFKKRNGINP